MTARSVGLFACLFVPRAILAEEPLPRVALVVETPGDPVGRRLRAELVALGFEVVDVAATGEVGRETLEAVAREQSAVAALRVVPSEQGVEVWLVDRVTGKTVLREVVTADSMAPAEDVVPVRAVELLRASLMEIDAPHEIHGEVPPPPNVRAIVPVPRPPPPPPPRFALSLGPAILFSPGGLSTAGDVRIGLQWRPLERVGVAVVGLVPAIPARLETPQYSTDISPWMIGAATDFYFAPRESKWTPFAGLGIGLVALRMVGQGEAGRVAATWGTAPFVKAGIAYAVTPTFCLGAGVLVGVLFPETTVEFNTTPVATWGRPFAAWSLDAELRF